MRVTKQAVSRTSWNGRPQKVTVLYATTDLPLERYLSKSGHVKPRLNPRRPFRKAKYDLATDSELVERSKGGKNPVEGRKVNLKPYAYKRSEPYVLDMGDGVPFA